MVRSHRNSRSGVTLIEVLVAIFVMSIGLLCVLTLFVLGAQRMATAFKDSAATQCAVNARAFANIKGLRNDSAVVAKFTGADDSPSTAVFVDPAGQAGGNAVNGSNPSIPRVSPSYATDNSPPSLQFFSLLDDITFERGKGIPFAKSPDLFEREVLYSWAYLVQRQRKADASSANAIACVFQRRPKGGNLETAYSGATIDPSTSTIAVPTSSGATVDTILPGMWVLPVPTAGNQFLNFYRVTGVRDGGSTLTLDLQTSLQGAGGPGQVIVFDGLVEVFDLGTGR